MAFDMGIARARRVVGPAVDIGLEGYEDRWIRPKKFSIDALDEINTLVVPRQAALAKLAAEADSPDFAKSFDGLDMSGLAITKIMRVNIKRGVEDHNLTEAGKPTDDWVDAVLEDAELARRCVEIVKEWNRPLPKPTSEPSETSSKTSSQGGDSA